MTCPSFGWLPRALVRAERRRGTALSHAACVRCVRCARARARRGVRCVGGARRVLCRRGVEVGDLVVAWDRASAEAPMPVVASLFDLLDAAHDRVAQTGAGHVCNAYDEEIFPVHTTGE